MQDISLLDKYYSEFAKNTNHLIPDGIYYINLELLHHFDLLHFQPNAELSDSVFTQHFHVIESAEKITLFNDQFIIWIKPEKIFGAACTYIFIALNHENQKPQLEATIIASGVYNTSKLVLNVLEKFLAEIQENERMLEKLQKV